VEEMIANIVIGLAIFGYAAYALVKFINKSKKGKCAACEQNKVCKTDCSMPSKIKNG
jgi:hypothetical protein